MKSLASLLFKEYRKKALELLLLNSDSEYHVREIARLTTTVAGTLHKELKLLEENGILSKKKIGNQVFYRANVNCAVFEELASILRKTSTNNKASHPIKKSDNVPKMDSVVENNRQKILSLALKNGVRNVRVFGSMARNDANEDSDLDLLVELEKGSTGFALGGFLEDVARLTRRKVDVVTEKSLNPAIREKVLQQVVTL